MNLIRDRWIPARRKSGAIERIAPWQITDRYTEDPFVGLAALRPDFNGALIQFLIGLLQTTCPPKNVFEWRKKHAAPPSIDELQNVFSSVGMAFELGGDGPRFMQDLTLEAGLADKEKNKLSNDIVQLLVDSPGGQTLEKNTDHFIKRGQIERLCTTCSAIAIFTLQTNAPSGGQGHRVGIRGGGPLTTLVIGESLWKTCWLNVLDESDFLSMTSADPERTQPSDRFPWLAPTRTSEGGRSTTPNDCHPDQVFWSMPRRLRLMMDESSARPCEICGRSGELEVRFYLAKNLGVNYEGPWKHPLSPYFVAANGTPSARHPQPGGIGYRHWLGMIISNTHGKGRKEPSRVVERFLSQGDQDLQIWAFGYDMDNMKARSWQDCTMPLLRCPPEIATDYSAHLTKLVLAAELASFELRTQSKKALCGREARGDASLFQSISGRFWQETEAGFYQLAYRLRDALIAGAEIINLLTEWHQVLVSTAEWIFDDTSQGGSFEAADPKRIATAWNDLRKNLHGRKMKETLGLPIESDRAKRARPARRQDGRIEG